MPDPFVTTQDLSDFLGRDVTADNGAVMAVDAACDVCRDISEQSFNLGTTTVNLDGTDTDALILKERPVTNVGTVSVDGSAITDFTWTANGMLFRGSMSSSSCGGWWNRWPRGRQNISVTYVHGYGTADVPRSVRMVALSLAARWVVQGVAESETVGDVTVDYGMSADDLTANELRILQKYRASESF